MMGAGICVVMISCLQGGCGFGCVISYWRTGPCPPQDRNQSGRNSFAEKGLLKRKLGAPRGAHSEREWIRLKVVLPSCGFLPRDQPT